MRAKFGGGICVSLPVPPHPFPPSCLRLPGPHGHNDRSMRGIIIIIKNGEKEEGSLSERKEGMAREGGGGRTDVRRHPPSFA